MKKKIWFSLVLVILFFSLVPVVSSSKNSKSVEVVEVDEDAEVIEVESNCGGCIRHYLVTIIRDDYGVPHVFSKSKEGLAYGAGYAMAQDRLWQADLYRRDAFGSLAEFGFASIDQDYNTRT
ncbi:MAG: penicillin acylase family protein, partial [Promethearchaeota archaeon]